MAMQHNFDEIRHIDPFRYNWTIKSRVVRLWSLPPYPKNSPHDAIEVVLYDRENQWSTMFSAIVSRAMTMEFQKLNNAIGAVVNAPKMQDENGSVTLQQLLSIARMAVNLVLPLK
ncbi:replication protein A 70 kDa DNA-binding subunit-like [Senna tora]|uniref:Replication protein A 70 kDa DNA-binding subunit-like n=1 Tax=Senna tora TaxID=362788 RepID=A0A834SE62_9FABA|nr:replication protein A 70 kDa DNA-binding subunit-like [Senna tora]